MKPLILEYLWTDLCSKYTTNEALIKTSFEQLTAAYNEEGRHYHTLTHIRNMISSAYLHETLIRDKDAMLFAIFFHDVVYDATAKDNEEKSAAAAVDFLHKINFWGDEIDEVAALIMATKTHTAGDNPDTCILLDLDLEILGTNEGTYHRYTQQIRQEYAAYPDLLYNPGRKKVLRHFLEKPFIYCTETFREQLEASARKNIENEIATL
ncbi:Predicted metal-dependent phosphohydrolase, HD superfamily [Chitinophaga jiangningensis]|uniref:Predicted metal-dependent phosphohydrolase, HD superfamily n=1 Tax=Chitinophaga jiangningensis TaxID=1419482 RepID=A0A1M6V2M7_9BACT|nr:hypothetical protein [Chitinophaga jiangningensis]SHK75674.1 Predicted metal-dependent phosphohydrolase, HD superfamily [Chitinophaga jiangningensis]